MQERSANIVLDGYVQAQVPVGEAYFAHVRFGWMDASHYNNESSSNDINNHHTLS